MNLIDDTKKNFAESFADAAKFSDQCDSKAKARGKAIFVIWALYLLLFLVPDSVWLNMGVILPNEANISNFVLVKMGYTKFPVSVFIFFVAAPFFFTVSLVYFMIMIMPARTNKDFLSIRKESGVKWVCSMIIFVIFVTIIPWILWTYPDTYLTPASGFLSRRFKPFDNKLWFFFIFGVGITGVIPLAISMLCLEIRLFFDKRGRLA